MRDTRRLRLLLALLLLTSFTLLTLDSRGGDGGAFGAVRRVVGGALAPVQGALRGATAPVGRSASAALDSGRDAGRITELERQLAQARRDLADEKKAADDVAALRALGYYGFRGNFTFVLARVVARGEPVGEAEQTMALNVGSADGVAEDMRVVTPGGDYVGRVRRLDGPHRCLVVLVSDRSSSTTVQPKSGKVYFTTLRGQGPGLPLRLDTNDVTTPLKVGQPFFTVDGTTGIQGAVAIPGGIQVGTVSRLAGVQGLAQGADVTPTADLPTLDQVGVAIAAPGPPRRPIVPNASPPAGPPGSAGGVAVPVPRSSRPGG